MSVGMEAAYSHHFRRGKAGSFSHMSRKRVGVAGAVAVVLFVMSPAFQGYHIGASRMDTTCVTRLVIQFCKNEHARIAREHAAAEARIAKQEAVAAAQECRAVAKEAEEGKRRLTAGNYYLQCLRPGVQQAVIRRSEAENRNESKREQAQLAHQRANSRTSASLRVARCRGARGQDLGSHSTWLRPRHCGGHRG